MLNRLIALLVVAALLVVGAWYWRQQDNSKEQVQVQTTQTDQSSSTDFSPSTPADNAATDQAKQDGSIDPSQPTEPGSTPTGSAPELIITRTQLNGSSLSVGVMTEASATGICTYRLNDGDQQAEAQVDTLPGNGSTGCSTALDVNGLDDSQVWSLAIELAVDGQIYAQLQTTINPGEL